TFSPELETACQEGSSVACLAWEGHVRGVFVLTEQMRPEAEGILAELKRDHLDVTILTGDQAASAPAWAEKLDAKDHAGLLPEQKWQHLQALREQGRVVAMVGDGINDGPALAASDVGIAMGCGADVARDAAEVCLLDNDLRKIPWAIRLAQQTVRIIRQ